jgi:hypothetical protein
MPEPPPPSVRWSSQYGKKARPWPAAGRQLLVNTLTLVSNWSVPFESAAAAVKGWP